MEGSIDGLRRNFLWDGEKASKGFNLVKWKTLLLSKKQGGLGIKNLRKQKRSLMMKWLWRFAREEQALWVRVIQAKYDTMNYWTTKEVTAAYGVSLWRSIRLLWINFLRKTSINVNNGRKVLFWDDDWLGNGCLKQLFPDIYLLNQQQQATIQEVWDNNGWNLTFRRLMNDWEIDTLAEVYGTIQHFGGLKAGEDTLRWILDSKGSFTVSSAYKSMTRMENQLSFLPWKLIWKVKIPYKATVFTWLVVKEVALTQENLMKSGIHLCPRCFFCEQQAETINHLFLHCKVVRQLGNLFTSLRGIVWIMPGKAEQAIVVGAMRAINVQIGTDGGLSQQ